METIIYNTSHVTDYSGEPPIVTDSNTVTTVVRQTPPTPIITRFNGRQTCDCCCCHCCGWSGCGWCNCY